MSFFSIVLTDKNGIFEISGCASDPDIPFGIYENKPDPYIMIKHHCNRRGGESIRTSEFEIIDYETHDVGYIDLDSNVRYPDSLPMLKKINSIKYANFLFLLELIAHLTFFSLSPS